MTRADDCHVEGCLNGVYDHGVICFAHRREFSAFADLAGGSSFSVLPENHQPEIESKGE